MHKTKMSKKTIWKKIFSILLKFGLFPIIGGILSLVIVSRVTAWWRGPSSYKIYVVGDFSQTANTQIWDAFENNFKKDLKIDGIPVKSEIVNYSRIEEVEEISKRLTNSRETLMVVGHFFSTHTEIALPNYLNADPPIPVILTTETNPKLIPAEIEEDDSCPIIRMSPTDKEQAETAAEFAIKNRKASIFWVIEDTENKVYSHYLAQEFINRIHEKGSKVVLWSTNLSIPSSDVYKTLNIDCVFFAGYWTNALILIRQIRTFWPEKQIPTIILSDWSVDEELIKQGGKDVEGIYLTHPLDAIQYNKHKYGLYGKDAAEIIRQIISDNRNDFSQIVSKRKKIQYGLKRLLNIHRVTDARLYINEKLKTAFEIDREFISNFTKERYVFKRVEGKDERKIIRKSAKFHIWKIEDKKFRDLGSGEYQKP